MPELPEVESARSVIAEHALERVIAEVDDHDTYECRPHRPGEIRDALVGRSLVVACRRGKAIWCPTSGDGPSLGIHLGMSGRILVSDPTEAGEGEAREGGDYQGSGPGGRAAGRKEIWFRFSMTFEDGGRLRLLDKRRLGRVRLDPDIDALGPDAAEVGRAEFRERVGRGGMALKARLLDQHTIAGVGNLLADEVLWQSGLDPRRPSGELSDDELDGLRRQLRQSIRSAIRKGGVHTGEVIPHRARTGHCPRCGAEMSRATIGGRTTYWCPVEQT